MVKYCPRCGAPNEDNAEVCTRCGFRFTQERQPITQPPLAQKSRKTLWVIIGVVLIIVIIIIAAMASVVSSEVHVTALNVTIQYNGLTSGYLGPTTASLPGFNATGGSIFTYTITFTSYAMLSHQITSITITTPGFQIVSISPSLPYTFGGGSTFSIAIKMQLPSSGYTGVLSLVINTS